MENKITFKTAKYITLKGGSDKISIYFETDDGEVGFAPFDLGNRHYAEIKRQVDAGELTIEDAD